MACCVVRGSDDEALAPACDMLDEDLAFFDCAENSFDLEALSRGEPLPNVLHHVTAVHSPAVPSSPGGKRPFPRMSGSLCGADLHHRDCADLAGAQAVLQKAREEWCQRMVQLRKEAEADLEWANLPTAIRMLRANIGDVQKAVKMFVQALELRSQHEQLFRTMRCENRSDIRIIGRDLEGHPVVYMCARSQTESLAVMRDQVLVTFEAACRLAGDLGTIAFVIDMHGLQPHLYMDFKAMKGLTDMLGTVFAERICRITIVDFSRAAQALWWALKPMLAPATKEKFAFVNQAQARVFCKPLVDESLYNDLCRSMEINRDPASTVEQRAEHAQKTTLRVAVW